MRIKVITKRYMQTKTDQELISLMIGDSMLGSVFKTQNIPLEEEHFIFNYDSNIIKLEGSAWSKPVKDLEQAFMAIKQYFHGTHYAIIDILQMQ